MVEGEINASLEDIVALIRVPPLVRKFFNGDFVLMPTEKERFEIYRKDYYDSFKRLISSGKPDPHFEFRFFLGKQRRFFTDDIFNFLDNLDNKSIGYVVGSLQFEENLKKYRHFIPGDIPEYTH